MRVVHRERLGHRLGRVFGEVEHTVRGLNKLVSAEGVEEHRVGHIGNHVARETGHRLTVEHTFPTEPTAEAVVAVVVVSSHTKLETLVERHRHVVQEDDFSFMAFVQTREA